MLFRSKAVTYYYLVAEGTVDAAVYVAREQKQSVIDEVLRLDGENPF